MTGVVTRSTKGVPLTATDHDGNLEVIVSLHKSATEPSPTYGCMLWADTNNDLLKMRNKANDAWITLGALDTTGAFSDNNLADQDQLSELSDVTITSVADNEVLAYDSTASKWINQTAAEAGLATSAQGTLADSALQDGDTVSSLTITSADINGGTIDGVTIGGSSAGAGTFTNLTATGTVTLNQSTIDGLTVGQGAGNVATNTVVGKDALNANTSGGSNTAIGQDALGANTTASNNTAVGYASLFLNTTGAANTALGVGALLSNTTASNNTAVGYHSLKANTTGTQNTASGMFSLYTNTGGNYNTANGYQALYFNTTGSYNAGVGKNALVSNTTGNNNTAVGYQAGYSNSTGTKNTIVGNDAGYGLTTGGYNVCIGSDAGKQITTGSKNTIIGGYNGNQGGLDIRTSSNNIVLSDGDGNPRAFCEQNGYWLLNNTSVINNSRLTVNNGVAITNGTYHRKLYQSGDQNFYFDNGTNQAYLSSAGSWTNASDARLKTNIRDIEYGLNTVISAQPRHFERVDVDGTYIGFVAQELQDVIPEVVSGDPETQLGVDYGALVAVAFKAIQQQQAMIEALEARIAALEATP